MYTILLLSDVHNIDGEYPCMLFYPPGVRFKVVKDANVSLWTLLYRKEEETNIMKLFSKCSQLCHAIIIIIITMKTMIVFCS